MEKQKLIFLTVTTLAGLSLCIIGWLEIWFTTIPAGLALIFCGTVFSSGCIVVSGKIRSFRSVSEGYPIMIFFSVFCPVFMLLSIIKPVREFENLFFTGIPVCFVLLIFMFYESELKNNLK